MFPGPMSRSACRAILASHRIRLLRGAPVVSGYGPCVVITAAFVGVLHDITRPPECVEDNEGYARQVTP